MTEEKVKKTVAKELTQYKREFGKIYKSNLPKMLEDVKSLPQKNPIAYEISRVLKAIEKEHDPFVRERSNLMSEYLLRDENGNWVVTEKTLKTMEIAAEQGLRLIPTEFGYEIDGDEDAEFEYKEKMNKLLNTEVDLGVKPVDASKKTVKVGEERLPLLDVISDYFETTQINFLEESGVLTGL